MKEVVFNQSINNSAMLTTFSPCNRFRRTFTHFFPDLDGSDSDILYGTNRSGSWDFHRFSIGQWVHQGSS